MVGLVALFWQLRPFSESSDFKEKLGAHGKSTEQLSYQSVEIVAGNIIEGFCQSNVLVPLDGGTSSTFLTTYAILWVIWF